MLQANKQNRIESVYPGNGKWRSILTAISANYIMTEMIPLDILKFLQLFFKIVFDYAWISKGGVPLEIYADSP